MERIGIIGLGYVGFPLACLMAKKHQVVGFDLKKSRVEELRSGIDSTKEVEPEVLKRALDTNLTLTTDVEDLRDCNFYIVAVPTPVDSMHNPDLSPLTSASHTVGTVLKKGDVVVYESTVYPGVTEEVCVPILANTSGLEYNKDFFVGYSPERVNPGDKVHTVENITKITSGSTPEAAMRIDDLYNSVLLNGTYPASSIRVAEAAKVVENTQRDVNIAFVNEIAMIFGAMGISVNDVIAAASTKWNYLPFTPGLVGGHCIGVDPYYLIHRAELGGLHPRLISEARRINDNMGHHMARKVLDLMMERDYAAADARVLIAGFTFKPDCPDIRNTKVIDVYKALGKFVPDITVLDPHANKQEVKREYGVEIINDLAEAGDEKFDVVVLLVGHKEFAHIDWSEYCRPDAFLVGINKPANYEALTAKMLLYQL